MDAAADYAQHTPMRVIANMLGFPPEDGPRFRGFVKNTLENINLQEGERVTRTSALFHYLLAQVHDHLDNPRDDLTTFLIHAELYGHKLKVSHILGTMTLLLIAGIDTTWSAIGAPLSHLTGSPEDRRRLAAEPGLLRDGMRIVKFILGERFHGRTDRDAIPQEDVTQELTVVA